jgi:hypothetical protein
VVISMVTRRQAVPYIRSPYIREQLEHPKMQLSQVLGMLDELRHRIGDAHFTLQQLTEDLSGLEKNGPDDSGSDA